MCFRKLEVLTPCIDEKIITQTKRATDFRLQINFIFGTAECSATKTKKKNTKLNLFL